MVDDILATTEEEEDTREKKVKPTYTKIKINPLQDIDYEKIGYHENINFIKMSENIADSKNALIESALDTVVDENGSVNEEKISVTYKTEALEVAMLHYHAFQ